MCNSLLEAMALGTPILARSNGGNCALLKPGSYAPATSHVISRLVQQYLDPAAIVVAEGDREVTTALLDQRFDKIFFTGSGFVGILKKFCLTGGSSMMAEVHATPSQRLP